MLNTHSTNTYEYINVMSAGPLRLSSVTIGRRTACLRVADSLNQATDAYRDGSDRLRGPTRKESTTCACSDTRECRDTADSNEHGGDGRHGFRMFCGEEGKGLGGLHEPCRRMSDGFCY